MQVGVSRHYKLHNEALCFYFLLIHQNLGAILVHPKLVTYLKNSLYYPLHMQNYLMWLLYVLRNQSVVYIDFNYSFCEWHIDEVIKNI